MCSGMPILPTARPPTIARFSCAHPPVSLFFSGATSTATLPDRSARPCPRETHFMTEDLQKSQQLRPVAMATALGCIIVTLGGFVSGVMLEQFGHMGAISLWAWGSASAWVQCRYSRIDTASVLVLCGCLFAAFCVAEIFWIRRNIVGVETVWSAIKTFPRFLIDFKVSAFIAAIFAAFGMGSVISRRNA